MIESLNIIYHYVEQTLAPKGPAPPNVPNIFYRIQNEALQVSVLKHGWMFSGDPNYMTESI